MDDQRHADFSELAFLKRRVTALEAQERQLRSDCEHLRQLYEHAPLSYQSLDEKGCLVIVNQAWLDTLGYTREEVVGRDFSEFLRPDRREHFHDSFSRLKATGKILGVEFEMIRKDGSTLLVTFDGKVGTDSEGGFPQTHCIVQDITARRTIQNELLLTQFSMDNSRDAIVWVRSDASYAYVNNAACHLLGYTREELLGKTVADINPTLSLEKWQGNWEQLRQRGSLRYEAVLVTQEGRPLPVEVMDHYLSFDGQELCCGIARDITERRRVEVSLRESEQKYRLLFDGANDTVCIHDLQGRILDVNSMACERLGYTHAELTAMSIGQLDAPEDAQCIPERLEQLMEQGRLTFETVHLCKDGTPISLEVSARRITWEGQPAIMSISRDITERKRAEVAVRESEARLRAITNAAKDAILMMDANGRISFWNPAAERIFGYPHDEAMGMVLHRLIAPQRYHATHASAFAEFKRSGQGRAIDATIDLKACHKDGHEIAVELSLSAFRLQESWHTIGVIRDVTERKRSEEALRESEERFRVLHDASSGGIVIHDQGVIADCNQALSTMTGYSSQELIGMDGLGLIAPEWRGLVRENIQHRFEQAYEAEGLRKDGSRFPLSIRGNTIPYKGRAVRVTEFRDISDRKQAEEERKQLQAQLIQAQKMEAIGTLAGGIAHDFNNILGAILGYAELARNASPPGSPAVKYLDKELNAIHRATQLVRQILAFSRQADTERIPLQLGSVLKDALKLLRPTLPSTITIKQQVATATQFILADPTQMHQILMNICTNAFHAMEQTGGTLEITLQERTLSGEDLLSQTGVQPGAFVLLSIRDSGSGISAEIRKRIFDPYFSTKEIGRGTGMGLAIVHGIVKSYGGFITVESAPGEGTAFHVFFPAIEEEVSAKTSTAQPVPMGKERILLIDDEDILAEIGTSVLESLGYEVTVRTGSRDALTTFQNQPDRFDVVITDQTMPGLTGTELAREMLRIRPDIPIILCTGYSTLVNEEQARGYGIREFAMKPVAMQEIATLLRKVLDQENA